MARKNKLVDLRDHLFATIEALQDPDSGMDVPKAKTIADLGKVIVDSARVEVVFIDKVGGLGSGFIDNGDNERRIEGAAKPMLTIASGGK
jgi:hypothetical protein